KHQMKPFLSAVIALMLALTVVPSRAADTIPAELSDAAFWKMISDFSEPGGSFQLEIITSNEQTYQYVLPQLTARIRPDGVYLGVAPEQNFTYIAALQPKIAFIFDIRRDMMVEHLMYKAVFEMSADRADFVSNLFSRQRPAGLTADSSVEAIFRAFANAPADSKLAEDHLKAILARLTSTHQIALNQADRDRLRSIYMTFLREGVVNFSSSYASPGYAGLMTMTDLNGKNWSFLAGRENYDLVRAMHQKNLIVPIVGDFAGPKALRAVGQYLKDHGAVVSVFYISNVEDYIQNVWSSYTANIGSLPMDSSSTFIRWSPGSSTSLQAMSMFARGR
ncbi:MAG TPA: hypothetical protein VFO86_12950, partial [Terriglobia bacterium]|nr:hypothetical protein [Terriglobia bacterium]